MFLAWGLFLSEENFIHFNYHLSSFKILAKVSAFSASQRIMIRNTKYKISCFF